MDRSWLSIPREDIKLEHQSYSSLSFVFSCEVANSIDPLFWGYAVFELSADTGPNFKDALVLSSGGGVDDSFNTHSRCQHDMLSMAPRGYSPYYPQFLPVEVEVFSVEPL